MKKKSARHTAPLTAPIPPNPKPEKQHAGHLAVVTYLLSEGAHLEQRSVMRETALVRAAHNGHAAVVEHLLRSGAAVDAKDLVRVFLCLFCFGDV